MIGSVMETDRDSVQPWMPGSGGLATRMKQVGYASALAHTLLTQSSQLHCALQCTCWVNTDRQGVVFSAWAGLLQVAPLMKLEAMARHQVHASNQVSM